VLAFRPPPRDKWSQLPNAAPVEPDTDTAAANEDDDDDEDKHGNGNSNGASRKKYAHSDDGSGSDSDSVPSRAPTSMLLKSKKAAKKAAKKQAQSLQHDEPQLSIDEDFDRVARRRQHAAEKRLANQGKGAGGRKGGGDGDEE
jgi:hypothetical protein